MNINIQIPDDAVAKMLSSNRRLQGTISLANAKEGNFHPHNKNAQVETDRICLPLRTGKAYFSRGKMSVRLNVDRRQVESPLEAITGDLAEARDFFEEKEVNHV